MLNRTYSVLLTIIAVLVIVHGLLSITGSITGYQIFDGGADFGDATVNLTDPTPPKWSEQEQSSDAVNPGDMVTLSATVRDDKALKSAGLNITVDKGKPAIRETQELSGTEALVVFRYTVPNYVPGTEIRWNIVFLDSSNNRNRTDTKMFVVSDREPPDIIGQEQEADEVVVKGSLLLKARVFDNYKLEWVAFESNDTGEFSEIIRYNLTVRDAEVSKGWNNPALKEGAVVGWRVVARDAWGNVGTSGVMVFKVRGCPVCPPRSDWSNCVDNKRIQNYFECSEVTNFTCVPNTITKDCVPGEHDREDAKKVLGEAITAITQAKKEDRLTAEAERLFDEAEVAYMAGDWDTAYAKFSEAKVAAETAEKRKEPAPNYLPFVAAAVLILALTGMLLRFGKVHLPVAKKFTPSAGPKVAKPGTGQICGVCGRRFSKLYTCEECGTKVCFDDARTWQGKVYCVNDLRKKGLI